MVYIYIYSKLRINSQSAQCHRVLTMHIQLPCMRPIKGFLCDPLFPVTTNVIFLFSVIRILNFIPPPIGLVYCSLRSHSSSSSVIKFMCRIVAVARGLFHIYPEAKGRGCLWALNAVHRGYFQHSAWYMYSKLRINAKRTPFIFTIYR